MQRPRGEKEPAVSGRSQGVQHAWSGKCQGGGHQQAGKQGGPRGWGAFQVASA